MSITYRKNKEYVNTSRYQILRVIVDNEDNETYLETYNNVKIPVSEEDTYHVVTPSEEGRLDIISNKYYGTPTYWWAIALANGFIDPFVVNEGSMVRIPSLMTLSDYRNEILTRRG